MIKKHWNKNEYYFAGEGLWVRNFTKKSVKEIDINRLIPDSDMTLMLSNEITNKTKMLQRIETESFEFKNIVIVSDGLDFEQKQQLLLSLPEKVGIIGVNDTLSKWNIPLKMNFYIVNNPYPECMRFLAKPKRVFPRCIASTRTNPTFIEKFNGFIYEYNPVIDQHYSGLKSEADYFIDDYRNPICAAIGLAYRFGVEKILLFCCDEVYKEARPGTITLENGFNAYPQQKTAQKMIDGNLFWLKNKEIKIGHHTSWPEYNNATYIDSSDLAGFFKD